MPDALRQITEGVLSDIEQAAMGASQSEDEDVLVAYAQRAAHTDVPKLTRILRAAWLEEGGDLGRELRDAVSKWMLNKGDIGKQAALAPNVELADLRVQSIRGQSNVIVDVRLIVEVPR